MEDFPPLFSLSLIPVLLELHKRKEKSKARYVAQPVSNETGGGGYVPPVDLDVLKQVARLPF